MRATLDDAVRAMRVLPGVMPSGQAPTAEQTGACVRALGFPLPPSYVAFWQQRPELPLAVAGLLGFAPPHALIAEANLELRQLPPARFPRFLLAFDFTAAIDDDYVCFDMRSSAGGEPRVVHWMTESPSYVEAVEADEGEGAVAFLDEIVEVAPDFPSYLHAVCTDAASQLQAVEAARARRSRLRFR